MVFEFSQCIKIDLFGEFQRLYYGYILYQEHMKHYLFLVNFNSDSTKTLREEFLLRKLLF